MEKLIQELHADCSVLLDSVEQEKPQLEYITSYFVSLTQNNTKWTVKNIEMADIDQIDLIKNLRAHFETYVDEFKTEDRDPEFIYRYNIAGLLPITNQINDYFINGVIPLSSSKDILVTPITNQVESTDKNPHTDLKILNYDGSSYPPNDEVNLIVHKLSYYKSDFLVFCNQLRTSLSKTSLKTILNNKLTIVEKEKLYKINNNISFIISPKNYFIIDISYFEKIFSFENYTKLKKHKLWNLFSNHKQLLVLKKLCLN